MTLEGPLESDNTLSAESKDREISEMLKSLGINFEQGVNEKGELVYTFFNVSSAGNAAYWLDAEGRKIIYQALHFGEGKFAEPGSKKEITPTELLRFLRHKFPEADKFIFSCCYPDTAKSLIGDAEDVVFIGSGLDTCSTFHSAKERKISSVRHNKST